MQFTVPYDNASEAEIGLAPSTLGSPFQHPLAPAEDSAGERSRSVSRYRRVAVTGLTSIFSKIVVLGTTIISVPLTYRYLGQERYGLWMTITSSVLFLGFADFGVGNGLAAAIAHANGRDDSRMARRQVSSGFFLLALLALLICLLLLPALRFIPWNSIYGIRAQQAGHEAGNATAILILCTALSMPLGTVLRVQTGLQKGYIGDLWSAAGNAVALGGIVLVIQLGGGLPFLVAAVAGIPLLATTMNWLVEFIYLRPALRPRFDLFDRRIALSLSVVGGLFFIQQCFGLLYYVSDNIVIARTMGAAQVAQYAMLQRIFSIGLVAQYFMVPLWPAIGEAFARRDFAWARRVIHRALLTSVALGLVCAVILLFSSRWLMQRWAGVDVGPVDSLRIGFAVWVVLVGYVASLNAILNQPATMRQHLMVWCRVDHQSCAQNFLRPPRFPSRSHLGHRRRIRRRLPRPGNAHGTQQCGNRKAGLSMKPSGHNTHERPLIYGLAALPLFNCIVNQLNTIFHLTIGPLTMLQLINGTLLLFFGAVLVLGFLKDSSSLLSLPWPILGAVLLLCVACTEELVRTGTLTMASLAPYGQLLYWITIWGFVVVLCRRPREADLLLFGLVVGAVGTAISVFSASHWALGNTMGRTQFSLPRDGLTLQR